jgi:hypothetical protein
VDWQYPLAGIRKMIKDAGDRNFKAKRALTCDDPNYKEKPKAGTLAIPMRIGHFPAQRGGGFAFILFLGAITSNRTLTESSIGRIRKKA